MTSPAGPLLSYREFRAMERTNPFHQREIPLEHYKSLPLPTLRWVEPAFATFACPARRIPHQPLSVSAPDRWWAVSANTGRLQVYAIAAALPFTERELGGTVVFGPQPEGGTMTLAQQKANLDAVEVLLDAASTEFFARVTAGIELRGAIVEALRFVIPETILAFHQALTPDFFAWLLG